MGTPKTLQQAIIFFADPANCQDLMIAMRWPDGKVVCPRCGTENVAYLENARLYKCYNKHEKAKFSLKVGTIFEDSAIGLDKWLMAMWMIANCKNGVSSYEIHRALGITQKSSWFVLHRIRTAMQVGSIEKLSGEVEIDESYLGGDAKNMHRAKRRSFGTHGMHKGITDHKTAVLGIVQRKGKLEQGLSLAPKRKT
jgi:transposase-like protein